MNRSFDDGAGRRAAPVVEIVEVEPDQLSTLRNLLQFYEYDFSEIEGATVAEDGHFHHLEHAEFGHRYFIRVDRDLAGFALINYGTSHVREGEVVWRMEEFFVMRSHRRTGVGRRAAHLVIERHPGAWEVIETPNNGTASAFWRRVLARYAYEELVFDDPKWGPRPLQRFSTP